MKILFIVCVGIFVFSCDNSTYHEPDFYYQGEFDPALADQVTAMTARIAASYGANTFEKNRDDMRFLTGGQEAFFVAYYFTDKNTPVLWITNVGAGSRLTLGAMSVDGFTKADLFSFVDTVKTTLLEDLGIELKITDPNPN